MLLIVKFLGVLKKLDFLQLLALDSLVFQFYSFPSSYAGISRPRPNGAYLDITSVKRESSENTSGKRQPNAGQIEGRHSQKISPVLGQMIILYFFSSFLL